MKETRTPGAGDAIDPRFDMEIHGIPATKGCAHFVNHYAVQMAFPAGPQGGNKPLRLHIVKNPAMLTPDDLKEGMFVYGEVEGYPDCKVIEIKAGVRVKLGTPHPAYQKFCDLVAKGALPVNDFFFYVPCENSKAERMAASYPGKSFAVFTYKHPEAVDPTCVNAINHKVMVAMTKDGVGGVLDDGTVIAINLCCLEPNAWPLFWNETSGKHQLQGKMINRKYEGTSYAPRHEELKVVQTEGIGHFPAFLVGDVEVLPDIEALFNFAANLRKH